MSKRSDHTSIGELKRRSSTSRFCLHFLQLPLFSFRSELMSHENITWNDNGTLSTIPHHPLEWRQDLSGNRSEDDILYLPNIALLVSEVTFSRVIPPERRMRAFEGRQHLWRAGSGKIPDNSLAEVLGNTSQVNRFRRFLQSRQTPNQIGNYRQTSDSELGRHDGAIAYPQTSPKSPQRDYSDILEPSPVIVFLCAAPRNIPRETDDSARLIRNARRETRKIERH